MDKEVVLTSDVPIAVRDRDLLALPSCIGLVRAVMDETAAVVPPITVANANSGAGIPDFRDLSLFRYYVLRVTRLIAVVVSKGVTRETITVAIVVPVTALLDISVIIPKRKTTNFRPTVSTLGKAGRGVESLEEKD